MKISNQSGKNGLNQKISIINFDGVRLNNMRNNIRNSSNLRRLKKKAFQLSISFLVTIILSIVIFGLSIVFIQNFFKAAEKTRVDLSDRMKADIESMLSDGSRVAIPVDIQKAKKGKSAVFGLGIRNTIPTKPYFFVNVACSGHEFGHPCTVFGASDIIYDKGVNKILNNDNIDLPIIIQVPRSAVSGKYIFNVNVYSCDTNTPCTDKYDSIQKIYVDVS